MNNNNNNKFSKYTLKTIIVVNIKHLMEYMGIMISKNRLAFLCLKKFII